MNTEQTEVELLEIAITAESKTKVAFAQKIGMSRQALNNIIREANKKEGKLKPKFVQELLKMHGVDIYKWKRNPTRDFYSPNEMVTTAAESQEPWRAEHLKIIEHLRIENTDLRERLNDCERKLDPEQNGRRSA